MGAPLTKSEKKRNKVASRIRMAESKKKEKASKARSKALRDRDKTLKKEFKGSDLRKALKGMDRKEAASTFNPYAYSTAGLEGQQVGTTGNLGNHYSKYNDGDFQMWNPYTDEEIHELYQKHGLEWNGQKNSRYIENTGPKTRGSRKYNKQYLVKGDWVSSKDYGKYLRSDEGRAAGSARAEQRAVERESGADVNWFNEAWTPEARKAATKRYDDKMTKGEAASMANEYEPSLFTTQNSFNTQATRDVASRKSGVVGNARAGNAVYNPKSNTRTAVSKLIKSRGQKLTASRKARSLDRATERMF